MKYILLIVLSLTSLVGSAHADALICPEVAHDYHSQQNYQLGIPETIIGYCGDGYKFRISGLGAGFRIGASAISITCPFVTDFRGTHAGVKVGADFLVGVEAGVYVGLGVCVLAGVDFGVGAGVSFGTLEIMNPHLDEEDLNHPKEKPEPRTLKAEPEERKFD